LIWGDSLSSAHGMPVEQGWVALLQQRLDNGYRIVNAAVSGETTGGGRSRLAGALQRHRPEIVIIELGANDGLRGIPPTVIRNNLEAMIVSAHETGAKVLLLGMKLPPNYGEQYNHQFEAVFSELAKKHDVPFVPFMLEGVARNFSLMQADGIHPTAKAQPMILDNVMKILARLLE